jgi:putative membrane protein
VNALDSAAMDALQVQIPALRSVAAGKAVAAIAALSVAVVGFLVWLIYFKPAAGESSSLVRALPALNAALNGTSAILLVTAYIAVRRRNYNRHMTLIFAALVCSTLFFISYVTYHHFHGDTKFTATGAIRPIYFFVLISHIVLSALAVPMILTSLYLSLSGKFATHRRVARLTLPVWLYVSVTGVLIFALLKTFNA